jgi:hypothetical protein
MNKLHYRVDLAQFDQQLTPATDQVDILSDAIGTPCHPETCLPATPFQCAVGSIR